MKILNKIWPWSKIEELDFKIISLMSRQLMSKHTADVAVERLKQTQAVSKSYRDHVSAFQFYCEKHIPQDIWKTIIASYIRDQAPRLPSVRRDFANANFVSYNMSTGLEPIESDSEAMKAAWEELRAKWFQQDKEIGL